MSNNATDEMVLGPRTQTEEIIVRVQFNYGLPSKVGIMEKKMETAILYRDYIGII